MRQLIKPFMQFSPLLALAFVLLGPGGVGAQTTIDVAPRSRVRVVAPLVHTGWRTSVIEAFRGDTLVLPDVSWALPVVQVERPWVGQVPRLRDRALRADATPRIIGLTIGVTEDNATFWRKAAQVAGGTLAGSLAGIMAWRHWDEDPHPAVKGDWGYTPDALTAYAVASYVGCTAAVYVIGRGDGSRGSLLATAAGSLAASIPLLSARNEPFAFAVLITLGAPLQAIGGTAAYQATRR